MDKKKYCRIYRKFDGHYTPECVNEHGSRLNGNAKPWSKAFKFCPFCGKECKVPYPFKNGSYAIKKEIDERNIHERERR